MNRRSFLRGLLGATALVPLAKIAAARQPTSLYEAYEFSAYETRIPGYMLINESDWCELFGSGIPPWLRTAMENMARDAPRAP